MDLAFHIPVFWCGYISGILSLLALLLIAGRFLNRKEGKPSGD